MSHAEELSGRLPLPDGELHVWYLLPERAEARALSEAYEKLLSPEERVRRDRYMFERNQREYLLTRALCRVTLSRYGAVDPAAWTFRANEWGRPEIDDGAHPGFSHLRFNLSNTRGLITCAITSGREVGVDVEDVERPGETVAIADRFFSPTEVASLRALPESARRDRFFDYWTLKEAYIKARGMGLAIPLDQFSFLLDDAPPVRIRCEPELGDDASTWQFGHLELTSRHRTAFAVRRGQGPDLRLIVRETVPFLRDGSG